jgi:hypothetical protein
MSDSATKLRGQPSRSTTAGCAASCAVRPLAAECVRQEILCRTLRAEKLLASRDRAILKEVHKKWMHRCTLVQEENRHWAIASRKLGHTQRLFRRVQKWLSNSSNTSGDDSYDAGWGRAVIETNFPSDMASYFTCSSGSNAPSRRGCTFPRSSRRRTSGTWAGSTRPGRRRTPRRSHCSMTRSKSCKTWFRPQRGQQSRRGREAHTRRTPSEKH